MDHSTPTHKRGTIQVSVKINVGVLKLSLLSQSLGVHSNRGAHTESRVLGFILHFLFGLHLKCGQLLVTTKVKWKYLKQVGNKSGMGGSGWSGSDFKRHLVFSRFTSLVRWIYTNVSEEYMLKYCEILCMHNVANNNLAGIVKCYMMRIETPWIINIRHCEYLENPWKAMMFQS